MIIFIKDINKLITAVEGTGDNLLDEDIAEGLKDYMMTSIYKVDGEDVELEDGGQMMTSEYIKDLDGKQIPVDQNGNTGAFIGKVVVTMESVCNK